jgi:hypothetical protein
VSRRSFIGGRIYEPGDEFELPDGMGLASHMEDLETGETGDIVAGAVHVPVFLDHRADVGIEAAPAQEAPAVAQEAPAAVEGGEHDG